MKTQYLSPVGLHFPVNWPGLAFSSFLRLSRGISCRLMPWLLALQGEETAASGKRNRGEGGQGLGFRQEDQTWCGRQEERAKAQRAHWLAPRRHRVRLSQQVQANHSPWLQIRWFGNGLVKADSAHKPVRVLNTLALEKDKRGEIYTDQGEGWRSFRSGLGETRRLYICTDPSPPPNTHTHNKWQSMSQTHLQLCAASTLHLEALVQSAKNLNSAHVYMDAVS